MRQTARIELAGEAVELLPERAVWWPKARSLIVSDLHLGKEHAFAAAGIAVPGGVIVETLERMTGLVRACGAERVIVVGDLLHTPTGVTPQVIERVARWRRSLPVEWCLVAGNHDGAVDRVLESWSLRSLGRSHVEPPFRFTHEPEAGVVGTFTWSGHLHPGVRIGAGNDSIRLPCFAIGERLGVLPSFSLFTGRSTVSSSLPSDRFAIAGERVFLATDGLRLR